jgi:ribonuclease G
VDAIKQILKKGEELFTGRRKKRIFKNIIVNAEALENRVAVLEDGQLEEFSIERTTEKRIVASVFKGKIKNLEPGLKAAFVDIGFEKNAFLHYWDIIPEQLDQRVDLLETPETNAPSRSPRFPRRTSRSFIPRAPKSSCRSSKAPSAPKARASPPTSASPAATSC